jgi:hypothetical protein
MKTPKLMGLKMPKPKAETNTMPATRRPVPTAKGEDIIRITTRMRETPMVLRGPPREAVDLPNTGTTRKAVNLPNTGSPNKDRPMSNTIKNNSDLAAELMKKKGK